MIVLSNGWAAVGKGHTCDICREPPKVRLEVTLRRSDVSPADARALAALLIEIADQVEKS